MSKIEILYTAFYEMMKLLLIEDGKIMTLLALCAAFCVWARRNAYAHRVIGTVPAVITLALGKGAIFYWAWFPNTRYLFADQVTIRNFKDIQPYLSLILSIWLIMNLIMALILVFGGSFETVLFTLLFLAGLAAEYIGTLLRMGSMTGSSAGTPAGIGAVEILSAAGTQDVLASGGALARIVGILETRSLWITYGLWGVICIRMMVLVWREGSRRQKLWLAAIVGLGALYLLFKAAKDLL